MKKYKIKKNTILIIFSVLLVILLSIGIFLILNINNNDYESVIFEPGDDCMVSDTACEEMDLLSSCPEGSVCKEMLVGWSSGDMGCPTYTVICFEEI